MTTISHLILGYISASVLSLDPVPALAGSVLPDKDLVWGLRRAGERTLFNSHRGVTHHPVIPVIMFLIYLLYFPNDLFLSFTVGYTSHLVADSLTPLGIPYRWGYYPRLSFKLFKTGSSLEVVVMVAVVGVWLYFFQPSGIKLLSNLIPEGFLSP